MRLVCFCTQDFRRNNQEVSQNCCDLSTFAGWEPKKTFIRWAGHLSDGFANRLGGIH